MTGDQNMHESSHSLRLKRQLQHIRRTTANSASRQFDWDGARKQIAASRASLLTLDDDAPAALAQLWKQRAKQLAESPAPEALGEQLPLTVIQLEREVYGLEVQYVSDVTLARSITRVPRVPPWVVGVVSQRGHIVSAIDLQRFMGAETALPRDAGQTSGTYLVNVQTADMEVALLVDDVLGLELIPLDQIHPIESAPHGFRTEFVRGATQRPVSRTADLLIVLNLPVLLSDERLIINETL